MRRRSGRRGEDALEEARQDVFFYQRGSPDGFEQRGSPDGFDQRGSPNWFDLRRDQGTKGSLESSGLKRSGRRTTTGGLRTFRRRYRRMSVLLQQQHSEISTTPRVNLCKPNSQVKVTKAARGQADAATLKLTPERSHLPMKSPCSKNMIGPTSTI
eukprot:9501241-Pyramimonas_sp.AAC.1